VINFDTDGLISKARARHLHQLLRRLGEIDLFIHDSLHSEHNVRFEVDRAWASTRVGGAVVVDDIDANCAFKYFKDTFSDCHCMVCEAEALRPDLRRFNGKGLFGIILKKGGDHKLSIRDRPTVGPHVRYWPKADAPAAAENVRFRGVKRTFSGAKRISRPQPALPQYRKQKKDRSGLHRSRSNADAAILIFPCKIQMDKADLISFLIVFQTEALPKAFEVHLLAVYFRDAAVV
jgi:hypothetical protein